MYLYHYFEKSTGPFKNLSDISVDEAKKTLNEIKLTRPSCQSASRDDKYMDRRVGYEKKVRDLFVTMGGKIKRNFPHYMIIEHSDWLYGWYENPAFIKIPIEEFDLKTLSFTYGDMHPTFSPIVNDGKEYRKKLYLYDDILKIINKYGLPQNKPPVNGEIGHPRYVEVQVWSEEPIGRYINEKFWEQLCFK